MISGTVAKELLGELLRDGGDPQALVEARGLEQITSPERLEPIIREVMGANGGQVEAYRGGRTNLFGFFVGQVMKATGGKADAQLVKQMLQERLEA